MATAVAVDVNELLEQSDARLRSLGYCFAPCGDLPPENPGLSARPLLAMRQVYETNYSRAISRFMVLLL